MIVVTGSPYSEDVDLPWTYDEMGFLHWVWEVFQEGYKRDVPLLSLEESLDLVRGQGYTVWRWLSVNNS